MYADDMLLLSKSEKGLNKALLIVETYCKKWQLVLNTTKTKIMLFNTRKASRFTFANEDLDIVDTYIYLGIKIHKCGTFTAAINDLNTKASKSFYSLRSALKAQNIKPRLLIKLYDTMVKPISLYASEVWGGFGIKKNKSNDLVFHLLNQEKTPYEKLNIKLCKQSLKVSKNASNMASRAELGRLPVAKSVITAVLKYYARLKVCKPNELLFHAFESQNNLKQNSNGTLTFVQCARKLMSQLDIAETPMVPVNRSLKSVLNNFGKKINKTCVDLYQNQFLTKLREIRTKTDSKLTLYTYIKTDFSYEDYLDYDGHKSNWLTRFRVSNHSLPIERGRYMKPKLNRDQRICGLCGNGVGDELHAMFECTNEDLIAVRDTSLKKIYEFHPHLRTT
jgi:hypothetical protein